MIFASSQPKLFRWTFAFLMMVAGCARPFRMEEYKECVRSGRSAFPFAVEMEQLFPATDHFITNFGSNQQMLWNTSSYFGGRYTLVAVVPITIDYAKRQVRRAGVPVFHLEESAAIQKQGGVIASLGGQGTKFGLDGWERLFKANGDVSTIGLTANNSELQHFDEYVSRTRAPVVRVSLLSENSDQ